MPPEKIPGSDKCGDAASADGVSRSLLVSCSLLTLQLFEFCPVLITNSDVVFTFPFG